MYLHCRIRLESRDLDPDPDIGRLYRFHLSSLPVSRNISWRNPQKTTDNRWIRSMQFYINRYTRTNNCGCNSRPSRICCVTASDTSSLILNPVGSRSKCWLVGAGLGPSDYLTVCVGMTCALPCNVVGVGGQLLTTTSHPRGISDVHHPPL